MVLVGVTGALTRCQEEGRPRDISWTLRALLTFGASRAASARRYAFIHAVRLNPRVNVHWVISEYYARCSFCGRCWLSICNRRAHITGAGAWDATALGSLVILGVVALLFVQQRQCAHHRADISYKQGLKFERRQQWDKAIYFYQQALIPHRKRTFTTCSWAAP